MRPAGGRATATVMKKSCQAEPVSELAAAEIMVALEYGTMDRTSYELQYSADIQTRKGVLVV
jgi:hypothetical protein